MDRPAAQRFTDKPYIEIGITDADLAKTPDFSAADADVVYVSCATPAAADRAATFFDSDPWRKLSANRDNRVYVVNDEIWQAGEGVVAARGIVDDLRLVNAADQLTPGRPVRTHRHKLISGADRLAIKDYLS